MANHISMKEFLDYRFGDNIPTLFIAIQHGLYHCTKFLLDKCEVDVNEIYMGCTALQWAIRHRQVLIIHLLLDHSEIDLKRRYLPQIDSVLGTTVKYFPDIFETILQGQGIDVNDTDLQGDTCYNVACSEGKLEIINRLLSPEYKRLVKTDIKDRGGYTASHNACFYGNLAVVKLLVQNQCFQFLAKDKDAETSLLVALRKNHINIIRFLLS